MQAVEYQARKLDSTGSVTFEVATVIVGRGRELDVDLGDRAARRHARHQ